MLHSVAHKTYCLTYYTDGKTEAHERSVRCPELLQGFCKLVNSSVAREPGLDSSQTA
jgi:hypothetical protein